ncbi:hypothetical protein F5888DRAFT_1667482 [Russula emetica]|nr:hypothetical protein F5888DRAFT_1667482 [Russula emetica]
MNLKNPLPPKPASSKPSNPKSSTNSGLNWKKLMNLKNPLMPKPASSKPSNPKSSTNSGYNWKKLMNLKNPLPPKPASSKESGQAQESQPEVENVQQPNPGPSESADPADFDWTYWTNLEDPPPPKPASPKEFGQAHESQPEVENVQQPNPGLSNPGPSNPSLPTEPELHPDHQSLSTDSEMDDLQAAIYASKGKAKQLRRISGTARDIGNAA